MVYTTMMFIFYTMTPIVYRLASSVFYNLSLLSANFFGLLFGKQTMHLPGDLGFDWNLRTVPLRTSSLKKRLSDSQITWYKFTALSTVLVVLCSVSSDNCRAGLLFLVYYTCVCDYDKCPSITLTPILSSSRITRKGRSPIHPSHSPGERYSSLPRESGIRIFCEGLFYVFTVPLYIPAFGPKLSSLSYASCWLESHRS